MNLHDNRFIICADVIFSIKDDKCAFGCVIFYKCDIVYAESARGDTCVSNKEAEALTISP